MIRDYDGKKMTPKSLARDMIRMALNGRMSELYSEIRDNAEKATDREVKEVERHLENYLNRMYRITR